ncbi:MAG: PilZ domain-containing protein [Rhodospirillaceae bacterium]
MSESGSGRRHERIPVNEPASIVSDGRVREGVVRDLSESGAAIEFHIEKCELICLDIGQEVGPRSQSLDRPARIIRHYESGFAVNFDDYGNDD